MGKAEKQVRDLFQKFKELHPNNSEEYNPTIDNVVRWKWSVDQAEARNGKEQQAFDVPDNRRAKILAQSRAIGTFGRMPPMTRDKFLHLASLFPGRKVYATGSRITGEHIDKDSPGKIKEMRAALLKIEKVESDYDITLDFAKGDDFDALKKLMPDWGDLVMNVPKGEPKIEIPMWDFSKLPVEHHADVVDMVKKKEWGKLMALHNDFGLSPTNFCCDSKPAERWFTWAVETGVIKKPEAAPVPERPTTEPTKPEKG